MKPCLCLIRIFLLLAVAWLGAPAAQAVDNDAALRKEAYRYVEQHDIVKAVDAARTIQNGAYRAKTFRHIAESQARYTDKYRLFPENTKQKADELGPLAIPAEDEDAEPLKQFLEATEKTSDASGPAAFRRPLSGLGRTIPPLPHPERLKYDTAYITAMLPKPGKARITTILAETSFYINTKAKPNKFKSAILYADANVKAGVIAPDVIYIESGIATLPAVYDALKAQGHGEYLQKNGKEYLLRHPLMVGPEATLIVDGKDVSELKLSREAGAGITNGGTLFVTNTKVTGWDEGKGAPAFATYKERYTFRPFISAWSRSKTYLAGSEFTALGYADSKAYGITISSGPQKLVKAAKGELASPTAIITDNSFRNLYFGFYCFEANDVVLIGNEYVDNIIYGIDPHDESEHLTIAYNTAYGSHEKHGIIISRRVNDASYIGNLVFENTGSGFMVDRLSTGTYIYANTAFNNRQDGITFFESSCNLVASNQFIGNDKMGVRIRNSRDNALFFNDIEDNKKGGVSTYTAKLETLASQKIRDFKLDPYSAVAGASLVGNRFGKNAVGIQVQQTDALYMAANSFVDQAPKIVQGDWFRKNPYLLTKLDQAREGTSIAEPCIDGNLLRENCPFRESGVLKGDGQDGLQDKKACASAATAKNNELPATEDEQVDTADQDEIADAEETAQETLGLEQEAPPAKATVEFNKPRSVYEHARWLEQQPGADMEQVVYWYKFAAQQGSGEAAFALAALYESGKAKTPSPESAKELVSYGMARLQGDAENGDGDAAASLAFAYLSGKGVEKNEEKFREWIAKAASLNSPRAQRALGLAGLWGLLPDTTQEKSAEMLEKATGIFPEAWLAIGLAYGGAFGGRIDHARSFEAFRKGAEAGNPEAARRTGVGYLTGLGTEKNTAEALRYIKQAAELGNRDAMFQLAMIHDRGLGTPQNGAEAMRWMQKADALDLGEAQYYLGMKLLEQDSGKGRDYLTKAASKKHLPAKKQLLAMEPHP